MALSLNHFSIRTLDIEATKDFYTHVLGLVEGPRPNFPFPGYWLYQGSVQDYANAAVHVIGIDKKDSSGLSGYLGGRAEENLAGSGAVDHIAFFATGLTQMLSNLETLGVEVRRRDVPGIGLYQLFLNDPNGIVIELNYPSTEKTLQR
jgi:catechol 2,3-dioxygenase-like lactoylglutathione lyase family enzyme